MADEVKKKEPTASEAMFFFAIVKHTKNKADVDWNAVAAEQGFKNAEVAKVRFGQVKRKLGLNSDPSASPAAGSGSTTTTPKKAGNGGGSASNAGTPTKVKKATPARVGTKGKGRGKVKKEEPEEEPQHYHEEAMEQEVASPKTPTFDDFKKEEGGDVFMGQSSSIFG